MAVTTGCSPTGPATVTAKPDPADVGVFMPMADSFDSSQVRSEAVVVSTISLLKMWKVPVFFGLGGRLPLVAKRRHWNAGKPNETKHDAE